MKKLLILAVMVCAPWMAWGQEDGEGGEEDPNKNIAAEQNVPRHDANSFTGIDYAAYKKEHIASKKYIPYVHVREADVLWQKTIWRMIDLREKINMPLYYPLQPLDGRKSLITVIYDAISSGDLVPYEAGGKEEFLRRITKEQCDVQLGKSNETDEEGHVIEGELRPQYVYRYLLKEVWFFDRKYSRMDVRILGICPIIELPREGRISTQQCFWIYFPELRPFLAEQEVFNTRNDAQRMSFDDLFAQRRFSSYIFQESNVYDNRNITAYAQSLDANLEARRIQEELFLKEHDMWEY